MKHKLRNTKNLIVKLSSIIRRIFKKLYQSKYYFGEAQINWLVRYFYQVMTYEKWKKFYVGVILKFWKNINDIDRRAYTRRFDIYKWNVTQQGNLAIKSYTYCKWICVSVCIAIYYHALQIIVFNQRKTVFVFLTYFLHLAV